MKKKVVLISVAVIILALLSGFFYWSQQPSFTIARVGWSVFFKNRASFDKSIDLDKVAQGLADDTVVIALKQLGADPLGKPGLVQSAMALQMIELLKPELITHVHKAVEVYFTANPIVNSSGQSLSSIVLMLLASKSSLKFAWKIRTEQNPDFAMVSVNFINTSTAQPVVLRFRLEKQDQKWRVVRIYNVVESLAAST